MFLWKEEFELGIPSIDDQHKRLLDIGNEINNLLKSHDEMDDNYDEIMNVLDELKDYTVYHFKTEEDLFLKYDYPESEIHKKEHDDFINYLNSVDFEEIDSDQKSFLKQLLEKIINWVFRHIINSDFKYKEYLIESVRN